jgi:hypothetical protein
MSGCSICRLPADVLEKVNGQIRGGMALRKVAKENQLSRVATWRHAKNCLKWREVPGAAAQSEKQRKGRKLEKQLQSALEDCERLTAIAVDERNTQLFLSCQKQRARLLGQLQRVIGKIPVEKKVTTSEVDSKKARWSEVGIFPADADEFFVWRFGGIRKGTAEYSAWEASLPTDEKTLCWEIVWRESSEQIEAEQAARSEASKDSRLRHEAWARLHEAGSSSPSLVEIDAEVSRFEKETADRVGPTIARMDAPHGESK